MSSFHHFQKFYNIPSVPTSQTIKLVSHTLLGEESYNSPSFPELSKTKWSLWFQKWVYLSNRQSYILQTQRPHHHWTRANRIAPNGAGKNRCSCRTLHRFASLQILIPHRTSCWNSTQSSSVRTPTLGKTLFRVSLVWQHGRMRKQQSRDYRWKNAELAQHVNVDTKIPKAKTHDQ